LRTGQPCAAKSMMVAAWAARSCTLQWGSCRAGAEENPGRATSRWLQARRTGSLYDITSHSEHRTARSSLPLSSEIGRDPPPPTTATSSDCWWGGARPAAAAGACTPAAAQTAACLPHSDENTGITCSSSSIHAESTCHGIPGASSPWPGAPPARAAGVAHPAGQHHHSCRISPALALGALLGSMHA